MSKFIFFFFCILFGEQFLFAQKVTVRSVPSSYSIDKDEIKLAELVNRYRSKNGLGELQVSNSLCYVARTHLMDVYKTKPDKKGCSLYSWSDKGSWKPCCFKNNIVNLDQMSAKPSEVAGFRGKGFETMLFVTDKKSITELFNLLLTKKSSDNFLLSTGKWESKSWQSMGVSSYKGFVSIWLSEIPDRFSAIHAKNDTKKVGNAEILKSESQSSSKSIVSKNNNNQLSSSKNVLVDSTVRNRAMNNAKSEIARKTDEANSSNKSKAESSNFKNYYLVHSKYTTAKEALKTMEFLKKTGFKRLILLDTKGEYRVILGVYPEKELAETAIEKLKYRFANLTIFTY